MTADPAGFPEVDQQPDFPALEERVLTRWRERDPFGQSLAARADGPLFSFYEGPPTANGKPGTHHVESRTFKDIFPRYRTMKGYRVPRKGGWDCHGIPVEIEVEKKLGFRSKADIEAYGVEKFNQLCRESVKDYVEEWNRLTERIAFWLDLDDAYWTMTPEYIQSVWWSLKQLWDRDLIYEGHKVVPYCGRCGTALSDHEVALGYAEADDPSVYVRFPVKAGPLQRDGAALLIWTTTPWTLISNTLVAVGRDVDYVLAQRTEDDHPVVIAAERRVEVLGHESRVVRRVPVDELLATSYQAPFSYLPIPEGATAHVVVEADFVSTGDGTGLVHMAPAFGADDYEVGQRVGAPVLNPVDGDAHFDARVPPYAGMFVKDADAAIMTDLADRGLLLASGTYTHSYPFCWRCTRPLIYYATPSWYIRTTALKDRLLEVNAGVEWHPEHIRDGRYGDWLANNVDWALSRSRYWGTPLPIWRCEDCGAAECVSSLAELSQLAQEDLSHVDPHRPYVDDVTAGCWDCGGTMRRVPGVIDAWYDSGSMPFAQFGYPHVDGSAELFQERFPADFICEAIDQTRGWFYSLMAVATLLFDSTSYERVLCLGHIVDADGRKMSKSIGNILDPWEVIERHGADALRWLLLTDGSPWVNRRVGHGPLEEVVRRFHLTLWNSYYFFVTYARIDGWTPASSIAPPVAERPVLDRWVLAELAAVVAEVDAALEAFDASRAGRALQEFVDDLSNWYIRRSRPRFWREEADTADKHAAFATLHECLVTCATLLAPFVPFLADELFETLVRSVQDQAPDSVHLLDFPQPDPQAADDGLRAAMLLARQATELGRRARNDARVPVRQPLARALVSLPEAAREIWAQVAEVVASELNVKSLEVTEGPSDTVTYELKADYRKIGRRFGPDTPKVAAAIASLEPAATAASLGRGDALTVTVEGRPIELAPGMVRVSETSRAGWQVASEGGVSVALDLSVDEDLRREGLARELIRALNDLRKRRGLSLSDRIRLTLALGEELTAVLEAHADWVAAEVLARDLTFRTTDGEQAVGDVLTVGGHAVAVEELEVVAP